MSGHRGERLPALYIWCTFWRMVWGCLLCKLIFLGVLMPCRFIMEQIINDDWFNCLLLTPVKLWVMWKYREGLSKVSTMSAVSYYVRKRFKVAWWRIRIQFYLFTYKMYVLSTYTNMFVRRYIKLTTSDGLYAVYHLS